MGEMSGPNITKLHSPASAFRPIQNEKPSNGKELLSSRLQHDRANLSPKRQRRKSETDVSEKLSQCFNHLYQCYIGYVYGLFIYFLSA